MADNALADVRDYAQLAASVGMAKEIVTKDYLCELERYEVCSLPEELRNIEIADLTRLYKFKKIVSDKNENTIDKLVTVLNSAFTSHSTVITLIDGNYDGTRNLLTSKLDYFAVGEINFCVNPYGMGVRGSFRRDIRIVKNARNSSGVEIIDQDSTDNHCK